MNSSQLCSEFCRQIETTDLGQLLARVIAKNLKVLNKNFPGADRNLPSIGSMWTDLLTLGHGGALVGDERPSNTHADKAPNIDPGVFRYIGYIVKRVNKLSSETESAVFGDKFFEIFATEMVSSEECVAAFGGACCYLCGIGLNGGSFADIAKISTALAPLLKYHASLYEGDNLPEEKLATLENRTKEAIKDLAKEKKPNIDMVVNRINRICRELRIK
jgi:hypothetical protein